MKGSWKRGRPAFFAWALCALVIAGCNSVPSSGIDPSGDRVFAAPPPPVTADRSKELYFDQPLGELSWDDASVDVNPRETVAPVGGEVVLIAGVCGRDGYLRTNRRLEWSIDPGGVGQFVDVGKTGMIDLMLGDFNMPRKITNTFAIGSTLRSNTRLNRGTCNPETNVYVLRGQGWISLTSAVEGTSNVTVFAPEVYNWNARLQSAMIHWVDAQWQFPPPGIDPAGATHKLCTTVARQTNKTPCERWLVRYEIVDGPPAGFLPGGAAVVEVLTDSAGRASVEISQKEPRGGTNKIGIQVIRPGDLPGANGQRLVVGSGTTMQTWTGAEPAVKPASLDVRISGPTQATVGENVTFEITVANLGRAAASNLTIKDTLDRGLEHPAVNQRNAIERILGDLLAGASQRINVTVRVSKPGRLCQNVEVSGPGIAPASAQACLTAVGAGAEQPQAGPATPTLAVKVLCPNRQLAVGETAKFSIEITNTASTSVRNVKVLDLFDRGLQPTLATDGYRQEGGGLAWTIDELSAGHTTQLGVHCTCQAVAAKACNRARVTTPEGGTFEGEACLEIREAATPPITPPLNPSSQQTPITPPGGLTLSVIGLHNPVAVGKQLSYEIRLRNEGTDSFRLVDVTATAPVGMTLAAIGTSGPDGIQPHIEGQKIRFDPVSELPAGRSLVYRIRVKANQPGPKFRFHVEATAAGLSQPLVQEASTEVF